MQTPSKLKPDEILLLGAGPLVGALSIFVLVRTGLARGWAAAVQEAAVPLAAALFYLAAGLRRLRREDEREGRLARLVAAAPPRLVLALAGAASLAALAGWWLLTAR